MLSISFIPRSPSDNKVSHGGTSSFKFGSSLESIIQQYNQKRSEQSRINKIYNSYGQEIPPHLWKVQIRENLTFYVE